MVLLRGEADDSSKASRIDVQVTGIVRHHGNPRDLQHRTRVYPRLPGGDVRGVPGQASRVGHRRVVN